MGNRVEELTNIVSELLVHSEMLAEHIRVLNVPEIVNAGNDRDAEGFDELLQGHDDLMARVREAVSSLSGDDQTTDFEELDDWRRVAADSAYEDFDFGELQIEDQDGWERVTPGDEWTRKFYVEGVDGGDTVAGTFSVRFEPGSADIEGCDALVAGVEVIQGQAAPSP